MPSKWVYVSYSQLCTDTCWNLEGTDKESKIERKKEIEISKKEEKEVARRNLYDIIPES